MPAIRRSLSSSSSSTTFNSSSNNNSITSRKSNCRSLMRLAAATNDLSRKLLNKMSKVYTFAVGNNNSSSSNNNIANEDGICINPVALVAQTLDLREVTHGPTDVTLRVLRKPGQTPVDFPVHKAILAQVSDYFRCMFVDNTEFVESESETILLGDHLYYNPLDPPTLALVIHHAYFGEASFTPAQAQSVLEAAAYLQIPSLVNSVSEYMSARIDRVNCLDIYYYAKERVLPKLKAAAVVFVKANFQHLSLSKGFAQAVDEDLVRSIVSSEDVDLPASVDLAEASLMNFVCSWASGQQDQCLSALPSLLDQINMVLMGESDLTALKKVFRNKRYTECGLARPLNRAVDEALEYKGRDKTGKIRYWYTRRKTRMVDGRQGYHVKRMPARWPKVFLVMRMYWKNLPMEYLELDQLDKPTATSSQKQEWQTLEEMEQWRSCACTTTHGGSVYVVGGEEADSASPTGSRTVNRVTRYDVELQRWSSAPSMTLARRWSAAVVVNGIIYVIGGIGGQGGTFEKRLDSVECLDLHAATSSSNSKLKWKLLEGRMSAPRSSHSAEALDGKIYVVGGGDGKEWLCTSEVFNPEDGSWTKIADLKNKRWKCGLCSLDGYLYAVGGMDSPSAGFWGCPLNSVERYDPESDSWEEVASLNDPRFGTAVVAYKGKLYVSGGFGSEKEILSSCECYDPATNTWTRIASMDKMSGFVGGVLVDRPVTLDKDPPTSTSSLARLQSGKTAKLTIRNVAKAISNLVTEP